MVALATVLAMRSRVLLLDEPVNGLDEASEERLIWTLGWLMRCAYPRPTANTCPVSGAWERERADTGSFGDDRATFTYLEEL
jgi:hypothetical protein